MSYATPAQYVQAYGLAELTQMLQDEEGNLDADLLRAALDAGGVSADATVRRALARLQTRLDNVSNTMDGYLRAAIALPVAAPALMGTLQDCCAALTRCQLADDCDNATERMDKACDTWRAWLRDVASGKVRLVDATGTTLDGGSSGRVVIGRVDMAVPAGLLQGFGGGFRS